ncbi:GNAT family N-acetyltransferase [Marinomonas atlantica]|uniref:GNAT family N-acetyltransferase n=1 Tax=Marinomonas atlantica TaxID=1806668 RepID=UPI0008346141|nr:GNAT family N-acetyltransferase [Marinomonas atlantica]MCO4785385.1 tRNA(Met) cytidine acetyltransferase [Marinomonas atlantica]
MFTHPTLHRQCVVSYSSIEDTLSRFTQHCSGLEHCLLVSHSLLPIDDFTPLSSFKQVNFNGLQRYLGNSYEAIFLDLSDGLHLAALSILAGTLRGGGLLVLHLGRQWRTREDLELARYLPWPLESHQVKSTYKHIFEQAIHSPKSPFKESWPDNITPYVPALNELTEQQQTLIDRILSKPASAHILLAARGRGKSFALAELIYQAEQQGQTCVCSASSPHNLSVLTQRYNELSETPLPFLAPDALLDNELTYDVLVIDEAASIPLPMLSRMLRKARCVVFSSTDYGYEGSGRGFGIRFRKQLKQAKQTCYEHNLSQPLRWGENDPLEHWLDQLLFQEYQPNLNLEHLPTVVTGAQWLQQPHLLDQAFSLLVSAHYQTSPENKRWLVDDPSVLTFLIYQQRQLVGVAIVSEEGSLPDDLAHQVMEGRRRPRGHLLPQSLLAHEGIAEAGQYRYWRISRIAIAPAFQRQGLGCQLIESIYQAALSQEIDFLCTSFAATPEVVSFWQRNDFKVVRLGSAKDQASGTYSLMMLRPLSKIAQPPHHLWCQQFSQCWLNSLPLGLQDLTPILISTIAASCIMGEKPHIPLLTDKEVSDLTYFSEHHRPYDSVRSQLLRLTLNLLEQKKLHPNNPKHLLLLGCALNLFTEKDAHDLGFSGKKDLFKSLKATVISFLSA